ncbi:hypothetical protein [uncultured Cutibacterium sp.]|uniref:hypothetical protein n=1 Tax=uncultured Cutibacterium sp. TaxID=1912223 RepID=UPI00259A2D2C|nr:hypothetical protein [uncultured Cutibacterium sp.]
MLGPSAVTYRQLSFAAASQGYLSIAARIRAQVDEESTAKGIIEHTRVLMT